MQEIKIPKMLTMKKAAEESGIAFGRIRAWALSGEIVSIRAGKKILINFDRFIDYLNGIK